MRKKFIALLTSIALVATSVPAYASAAPNLKETNPISTYATTNKSISKDEFLNSDIAKESHAKELKTLPKDAKVLKFNTWDEAAQFLLSTKKELDSKLIKNRNVSSASLTNSLVTTQSMMDYLDTDYYQVGYATAYWGTGTSRGDVNFNCPGFSGQTVYSQHYFNYYNGQVTGSSRGSYINGLGISTWSVYYSDMIHPNYSEWYSLIKGLWGYYISVGGQNIGFNYTVALLCNCKSN